jgi:hypothetical protein
MAAAEDKHVIEALGADAAHPPLRDRVGERCRLRSIPQLSSDSFA